MASLVNTVAAYIVHAQLTEFLVGE